MSTFSFRMEVDIATAALCWCLMVSLLQIFIHNLRFMFLYYLSLHKLCTPVFAEVVCVAVSIIQGCVKVWDISQPGNKSPPISQLDCLVCHALVSPTIYSHFVLTNTALYNINEMA